MLSAFVILPVFSATVPVNLDIAFAKAAKSCAIARLHSSRAAVVVGNVSVVAGRTVARVDLGSSFPLLLPPHAVTMTARARVPLLVHMGIFFIGVMILAGDAGGSCLRLRAGGSFPGRAVFLY